MGTNTLIIICGYVSIRPKPYRKAYLNLSETDARFRFAQQYPGSRDITVRNLAFEDELTIQSTGEISGP